MAKLTANVECVLVPVSYRNWLAGMALQGLLSRQEGERTMSCDEVAMALPDYVDTAIAAMDGRGEQILHDAMERSGMDLSPCMRCGELVVCVPDGMPCCDACAATMGADDEQDLVQAETGGTGG